MFESLTGRLSHVMTTLRGEARLTETNIQDALREVRMALLEADVALPVVRDFVAQVRERALGQEVMGSLTPGHPESHLTPGVEGSWRGPARSLLGVQTSLLRT